MTNATPKQLYLARKIVATVQFGPSRWREADVLLSGKLDHTANVQIALAAIIETTERAAKWIVSQTDSNDPFGIHEDIAEALRNQEHLK